MREVGEMQGQITLHKKTDAQPVFEQQTPWKTNPLHQASPYPNLLLSMTLHGMEYPFGQFMSHIFSLPHPTETELCMLSMCPFSLSLDPYMNMLICSC